MLINNNNNNHSDAIYNVDSSEGKRLSFMAVIFLQQHSIWFVSDFWASGLPVPLLLRGFVIPLLLFSYVWQLGNTDFLHLEWFKLIFHWAMLIRSESPTSSLNYSLLTSQTSHTSPCMPCTKIPVPTWFLKVTIWISLWESKIFAETLQIGIYWKILILSASREKAPHFGYCQDQHNLKEYEHFAVVWYFYLRNSS